MNDLTKYRAMLELRGLLAEMQEDPSSGLYKGKQEKTYQKGMLDACQYIDRHIKMLTDSCERVSYK